MPSFQRQEVRIFISAVSVSTVRRGLSLVEVFTEQPPFVAADSLDDLPVTFRNDPRLLSREKRTVLIDEPLLGIATAAIRQLPVHRGVKVTRADSDNSVAVLAK